LCKCSNSLKNGWYSLSTSELKKSLPTHHAQTDSNSKDDEIMQFSEVDKTAQKGQYLIAQGNALGMNAKINYAL
jgi:hypothetical protein